MAFYLQYVHIVLKTDDNKMDKVINRVMKPLKEKWNMVVPNVVISVTGGADKTPMDPRVNEMLSRLVEVAHNTGNHIMNWTVC